MVELSGKVVEHEIGYRAATATAVAMVVITQGRLNMFEKPDSIARLFAEGRGAIEAADRVAEIGPAGTVPDITAYLDEVRLLHEAVGDVA